jgi:hypothetical protein
MIRKINLGTGAPLVEVRGFGSVSISTGDGQIDAAALHTAELLSEGKVKHGASLQQQAEVRGLAMVPIPGTRKHRRLLQNAGISRKLLNAEELEPIAGQVAGARHSHMSDTWGSRAV